MDLFYSIQNRAIWWNSVLPDSNDLLSNGLSRIFGGLPEDILM